MFNCIDVPDVSKENQTIYFFTNRPVAAYNMLYIYLCMTKCNNITLKLNIIVYKYIYSCFEINYKQMKIHRLINYQLI